MDSIVIIADDLTGANDTAVQFWKQGLSTVVMVGQEGLAEVLSCARVVALNLDSRVDAPEVAATKVSIAARQLRQAGVSRIYKKIDSTLRGNLGAETDALLDEMQILAAVVTPAFPATNRAVVGGYLMVGGLPVTDVVQDERVSASKGHLAALLRAQSRYPVASLELPDVAAGPETLAEVMKQAIAGGARLLAADASTEEHLRNIVKAAEIAQTGGLLVGSGGLALALAGAIASVGATRRAAPTSERDTCAGATQHVAPAGVGPEGKRRPVLVLAGSYSAVTKRQVEVALEAGACRVELDLDKALATGGQEAAKAAAAAAIAVATGSNVVVTPSGPMRPGVELQVASLLAEVGLLAMQQAPVGGIVLTGGDIAMAACRAMGAQSIAVIGEVAPGLPAGKLQGGAYPGLQVVTKAGAFGAEDALQRAIQFLAFPR